MGISDQNDDLIQFGPFELDLKSAELSRRGLHVPIQPAALKLLELLASHPGELISRGEIRRRLWPEEKVSSTESLDLRLNFEIRALRKVLNDSHAKPRFIQTIRKRGYKFIAPVQTIKEGEQEIVQQNGLGTKELVRVNEPFAAAKQRTYLTNKVPIAALAMLILAALGAFMLAFRSAGRPSITFVSPILPKANQKIIIMGSGFGSYTHYSALDTPYLAIRDQTSHWAAGRIMERNWDKVTLTVTRWLNSEIDVTAFDGPYGQNGWKLNPDDEIEVAVWNPQTGSGPALYHLKVAPVTSRRSKAQEQGNVNHVHDVCLSKVALGMDAPTQSMTFGEFPVVLGDQ